MRWGRPDSRNLLSYKSTVDREETVMPKWAVFALGILAGAVVAPKLRSLIPGLPSVGG